MSSLQESLFEALIAENLKDSDWLELIQRLLDYGVLCRDESRVEADLYDRFVRVESLVDDYLALMGVRLHHDSRFQYVRLIPPGARVPGLDDESDTPFNGGLRSRLNQHEVAVILTLRTEYDKSLREGKVDETGCVNLSVEALALSLKNLLSRSLPDSQLERKQLFKRLRQLRVIRFGADADLLSGDSWMKVRPMVVNLVSNELIEGLLTASHVVDSALSENSLHEQQLEEKTQADIDELTQVTVDREVLAPTDIESDCVSGIAHEGGSSLFASDVDIPLLDEDE
ncbi:DUF4194 domain-containing protein [Aestuariicella hydrocarbonica]|uniref:DUF4194 domain-containing protein n=1 Tax=Pseudomaricurvus hydrocarbonicus TaxID=1470433 RepID=A0A9E5JTW5_9GAMM|nr:DUF4194 domain-containing protein [Aestuariicella hydrocarbonica]NHO65416.1 DUF4194 domain-containing protein [Aestuariicella hydrocarbonica]